MRNTLFIFLSLLYFTSCNKKTVSNDSDEIIAIGDYSYWENSMCAQNCSVISVANFYNLIKPLPNIEKHSRDIVVLVEGKLKTVEELITVAGPNSDMSNMNKTEKKQKLDITKYKQLDFPSISIDSKNKKLCKEKSIFEIALTFKNPTNKKLTLFVTIDKLETKKVILKGNEKKTIPYKITNEATAGNEHFLSVLNFDNTNGDYANQKEIAKKGVVVRVERYFQSETLIKD